MTITAEGAAKALFILDACNLNAAKQGQALVWAEVIADSRPTATNADLLAAVKRIAMQRNAEARGGTWVTPGDVIAEMRKARNHAIDTGRPRELESAPVSQDMVRELIASVAKTSRETSPLAAVKAAKEEGP